MRFDLHVHSDHSVDSGNKVEDILDACLRRGISGVAIMDHNTMDGYLYAASLGRKDIIIIPGMEVSSAKGHILAYNIKREVPRDLSVKETIEDIRAQGGVAVAAHPYRMWSGLGEEVTLLNDFGAIEVQNGRSTVKHNDAARKLAGRMSRPFTAGSDSHENETVGMTYFESRSDCLTADDVMREVLSGNGSTGGRNRPMMESVGYGVKCIGQWMGRGLKKM